MNRLTEFNIDVRPYPWWERFRVGLEVLIFGSARFEGELRFAPDVDSALQRRQAQQQAQRR